MKKTNEAPILQVKDLHFSYNDEKETLKGINLDIGLFLKDYLNFFGFNVVMTRTTENGLYNPLATNKKKLPKQTGSSAKMRRYRRLPWNHRG